MSALFCAFKRTLRQGLCSVLQPKQLQTTTTLTRGMNLWSLQANASLQSPILSLASRCTVAMVPYIPCNTKYQAATVREREEQEMDKLRRIHLRGPFRPKRVRKSALDGKPFMKGVVLKTLIKKPKKPNSANRKCVLVRLTNGREMFAYIPGIGHNLQEHNIVLVRVGRTKDVPGLKLKCVRGKYDLPHVIKR